ncbi:MAG TPA: hypothetical protein PK762_06630, partial [Candidatus Kapabacteria bacterium]|nr:hypothetical protein [Candidatus Kapabacteria bacterium]
TLEFNNGVSLALNGGYDSFFSKFNDNGICQFANGIDAITGTEYFPIIADSGGNIYIAKDYSSDSIIFNNENILFREGTRNVFLAKYNSTGIFEWVERITGNDCWATSISIDNLDKVYLTGYFNSQNLTFNNNISLNNIGSYDGYFAKFDKNKVLSIELNSGWNLISSNVMPENTNIIEIFSEVNNLKLVKNQAGNIYDPAFGINTIGNWNINHGYWVYMTAPSILQIIGLEVNPLETPINLNQGWNLVSYLRNSEMLAPDALQGITGSMLFAKDRMGNIYHPGYGINNLGNMQPGQGYWIYMNAPAVLTYPGN